MGQNRTSDNTTMNLIGISVAPLDPRLTPFQNNGGPTFTHALMEDSPAINAGNTTLAVDKQGNPLLTDQRGFTRLYGPSVDIGAYEFERLTVGMYIDSDNNGGHFGPPDFSSNELAYKYDETYYGKLILPNWGDFDHDGVLDCWDGFGCYSYYTQANPMSSEIFVPIVVRIEDFDQIDYANSTLMFDYAMYAMNGPGVTMIPSDTTKPPVDRNGEIRIWTKNGYEMRSGWNLADNGHFVESGIWFTLEELGFLDEYGDLITTTITLYVEGVSLSSSFDNTITVNANYVMLDSSMLLTSDSVRYAVAKDVITGRITYDNNDPVRYAKVEAKYISYISPNPIQVVAEGYTNKDGYYFCALTADDRSKMEYVTVSAWSDHLQGGRSVSVEIFNPNLFDPTESYEATFFNPDKLQQDKVLRDSNNWIIQVDRNISSMVNDGIYNVWARTSEAFYIYDAMVTAAQIHATLPDVVEWHVPVVYSSPIPATFAFGTIYIESDFYSNWDTILHEYGHIVAQEAGFFALDFPQHVEHHGYINSRDDYNHVCSSCAYLGFSEGWAHFYAAYAKQHNDAHLPSYILPLKYFYDNRDPDDNNYQGEDLEMAVMQLFWDLYDDYGANELFDKISLGINGLYDFLREDSKNTVCEVWNALIAAVPAGPNYLKEMTRYGAVFAEHGMGVKNINSSTLTWQSGNSLPTFNWDTPKTTQSQYYLFDTYFVEFYDSAGNMILSSGAISSPSTVSSTQLSWIPSPTQWATITGNSNVIANQKIHWVVRCTNYWPTRYFPTLSPFPAITTGPYWSDEFGTIVIQ